MATCDQCGATILFGGARDGDYRYCNASCRSAGLATLQAMQVSDEEAHAEAARLREYPCPDCGGEGPIDVHSHHFIWSALAFTRWGSKPRLSCRGCARKRQLGNAAKSMVLGWWGFPWGVLLTPVMIVRNVHAAMGWDDGNPSPALVKLARHRLADGARSEAGPR